jgi:hypothetical protein
MVEASMFLRTGKMTRGKTELREGMERGLLRRLEWLLYIKTRIRNSGIFSSCPFFSPQHDIDVIYSTASQ